MRKLLLSIAFALLVASFGVYAANADAPASVNKKIGRTKNDISNYYRLSDRGYFGLVEAGEGFVTRADGVYRTSLHVINGYRIFPQLSIGFGVGVKLFHGWRPRVQADLDDDMLHTDKTNVALPLFIHIRTDILKESRVTPYVAFNGGYIFSMNKGCFGGYLIEPIAGIGIGVGKSGNQFNVGVGYQMHEIRYKVHAKSEYGYWITNKLVKRSEMHGAVNIMIGFMW